MASTFGFLLAASLFAMPPKTAFPGNLTIAFLALALGTAAVFLLGRDRSSP